MNETKNQGLVIGRFQIVGNNHVNLFEQIVEYHHHQERLDQLNVGIGIADKVDFRNPYSGAECWQMIKPIAEKAAQEMNIPLQHRLIDDLNDPPNYAAHVESIFGLEKDRIIVFSGNDYTKMCFNKERHQVVGIKEDFNLHSTKLRQNYCDGEDISRFVPEHILPYLKEHGGSRRLRKLKYNNPTPTVDIIIQYQGGIVLVEIDKSADLKGLALPGGHHEYGESGEQAAVREGKEETGLDIEILGSLGAFTDPQRDPREHKISNPYVGIGRGTLKAGDDAKKVYVINPLKCPNLLFDHNDIVEAYLKWKTYN